MNQNKQVKKATQELFDILFCDGGVDYFSDAVRETLKAIKKHKITDPDATEEVWKYVTELHFGLEDSK